MSSDPTCSPRAIKNPLGDRRVKIEDNNGSQNGERSYCILSDLSVPYHATLEVVESPTGQAQQVVITNTGSYGVKVFNGDVDRKATETCADHLVGLAKTNLTQIRIGAPGNICTVEQWFSRVTKHYPHLTCSIIDPDDSQWTSSQPYFRSITGRFFNDSKSNARLKLSAQVFDSGNGVAKLRVRLEEPRPGTGVSVRDPHIGEAAATLKDTLNQKWFDGSISLSNDTLSQLVDVQDILDSGTRIIFGNLDSESQEAIQTYFDQTRAAGLHPV